MEDDKTHKLQGDPFLPKLMRCIVTGKNNKPFYPLVCSGW